MFESSTKGFRFLKQQSCHKAHERTHDTTDANRDRVGDDLRSVVRCHNRKSKCFRNLSDNKNSKINATGTMIGSS